MRVEQRSRITQVPFVLELGQVDAAPLARVGGKNAALGELTRELAGAGVRVPPGFALTTAAWNCTRSRDGIPPRAFGAGDLAASTAPRRRQLDRDTPRVCAQRPGWPAHGGSDRARGSALGYGDRRDLVLGGTQPSSRG